MMRGAQNSNKSAALRPSLKISKYRIIYSIAAVLSLLTAISLLHNFLAVNNPVNGEILVVEGWLPQHALVKVKTLFDDGGYQLIAIVGIDNEVQDKPNSSELAAAFLVELGLDNKIILITSAPYTKKDKTRSYAAELKKKIEISNYKFKGIDVVTLGAHGRKSHLVFKRIFEPDMRVGIISINPESYNSKLWWISMEGWQWVTLDMLKYIAEASNFDHLFENKNNQ